MKMLNIMTRNLVTSVPIYLGIPFIPKNIPAKMLTGSLFLAGSRHVLILIEEVCPRWAEELWRIGRLS